MPLHRDIHWLGRQWVVTGHGLQLINQKQMGNYDIGAARLWDARAIEAMQSEAWIDRPDFDKALEIGRARFAQVVRADMRPSAPIASPPPPVPATPSAAPRAPLEPTSVTTIEELLARLKSKSATAALIAKPAEAPILAPPKPEARQAAPAQLETPAPRPVAVVVRPTNPTTRAGSAWPVFDRKIAGSARFVHPWRVTSARWHGPRSGLPPRP